MSVYKRERSRGYRQTFGRSGISRARFLRLIGTGAGLSLLPLSSAILGARPGVAQTASPADITGGEFPIGVWWPPPPVKKEDHPDPQQETNRLYAEIAGAGFNFVIGGNGVSNDRANGLALEASALNGLRFVLTDGSPKTEGSLQYLIKHGSTDVTSSAVEEEAPSIQQRLLEESAPETISSASVESADSTQEALTARIDHLLGRFKSKPALASINMFDEPHKKMFERLRFARKEIERLAPLRLGRELLPYANAWPSYASKRALGTKTYAAYLRALRTKVAAPVLSFDHYPLLAKGITTDYFHNWAVIRKHARRDPTVPAWGFIQSVGFDGRAVGLGKRRRPTKAEIRWQVNVALAYGAKGLQYFTYWTPDSSKIKFGNALIDRSGDRTDLYDYARSVNAYLKKVGKELLPLASESVVHAREKRLPRGAKEFKADNYVRSVGGSPVILSRFRESPERIPEETDRYLLVVNRWPGKTADTRLKLSGAVTEVRDFNEETGVLGDPYLPESRRITLRLAPGAARLFFLRTTL